MRTPRVRVLLGHPEDTSADLVIRAGWRERRTGRIVTVAAPRWHPPNGPERMLAEVYRHAMAVANAQHARSMALPAILARGAWPLDDVTRIAVNVLTTTPTTLSEVMIVASTPAMVERWAEALIAEAPTGPSGPPGR